MTCGSCVARIEKAILQVPGTTRVSVNLTTEIATIEHDQSSAMTAAWLKAIRQAGYDGELARPADRLTTSLEKTTQHKLFHQQQAMWHAISLGVPILAIHWLSPMLQSSATGGAVWPVAIQAMLCGLLLRSAAGAPILVGGLRALIHRSPNMDLLIALGVTAAFLAGVVSLLTGYHHPAHFHAAAMILIFINLGRYLEIRAKTQTTSAMTALAKHIPRTAQRVTPDGLEEVRVEQIQIGDKIRIAQDTCVPIDGRVVEGDAAIDVSAITGESIPRNYSLGDDVPAGGVVRSGLITLEATRVGQDSTIGRIIRAVEQAQVGKTQWQRLADRVAGVFVPIVITLAAVTLLGNMVFQTSWPVALTRAVAVLVIACPCAMGLATPTAVVVATGVAALKGLMIKDPATLESAARLDRLVLDKTGTLTTGHPAVGEVKLVEDSPLSDSQDLLRWAASAEQYSQHPLAKAIVQYAQEQHLDLIEPDSFESHVGRGVMAQIQGKTIRVGGAKLMVDAGIERSLFNSAKFSALEGIGSIVWVAMDGRCAGYLVLTDQLRPDAKTAIDSIRHLGLTVSMMTGDHKAAAQAVADELGIQDYSAEMTPLDKQEKVQGYVTAGHRVAFVGDGINDAPALAAADVGVTFASATDVAVGAADITIVHDQLDRLAILIKLARRSVRIIKQNLFWAFFYNVVAIPLAALGQVPPGYAAAAMMISSITVVLNSLRLRKFSA